MITGVGMVYGVGAIGADLTTATAFRAPTRAERAVSATEPTAVSARSILQDPVTYAVAGGAILAGIGGLMLYRNRRRRRR